MCWVYDSPSLLLPGCLGGAGVGACSSEQGRGKKEQQQAALGGGAGWMGTGVAPGVRHDPVFGSPGEEVPPLHPCLASLPRPTQSLEPGEPPGGP